MVLRVIFNPCYNFAGSAKARPHENHRNENQQILLSPPNQHQRIRRKVHVISMTSYAFLPYCNCMYCLHVVHNYVNNTFLIYSFFWLPLFDSLALIGHMNEVGAAAANKYKCVNAFLHSSKSSAKLSTSDQFYRMLLTN